MSFMTRPTARHPKLPVNELGLTVRDYEGGMSTLCAGCGHDSITAAIVQSAFELSIPTHRFAKLSGIGCSSKTPAYFLRDSHGFNSTHGRMPSVATGANSANRDLTYIGVSGDGDSLSIGMGQFAHAIRRNLNMVYIIENNGVYGLTKGQFSAAADKGSKAKKGEVNLQPAIDPCQTAITLGASFVARSFSGDKDQLVPLLKAAMKHQGFSLVDIISPCVTFNDHVGSTKSYEYTRAHFSPAIATDFVPPAEEIKAKYNEGEAMQVELHDGSHIVLRKIDKDFNPTDRISAMSNLQKNNAAGEITTGLLYVDESQAEMHELNNTSSTPLVDLPYDKVCPGNDMLQKIQARYR
ncbi:MAG: 2-oxoacid:ferredoxin oxidoreductase subunit beta [Gammaproteobacteria bacterium]|nr:2-oxoacid:ferredoxin oxidoreductase subunit beta [Gammaproteobacteria bacterium]MCP4089050.1 2-oxoacid:ferredoxin oxidoreductase subunit beta [Gammaproteobacteria bacterium]MCP4278050.1 2-oxoacid:ferredoxin oxidoreductase subunit beta [Gammaproteobacteria bacterium]MCP4833026.1 2-oxoacid:ferredoxin oxidoreductase subunit beta [Gammaproteobacteria bacterium]MCP4929267.1 2-oxoacid:ferredoxin oxidoreductase subunit beta [Gammaproteobacteria bacterium]